MRTANEYFRERFGCKVYKLCLDGGFTCPNRDGTVGDKGCLFCSPAGGGEFAAAGTDIAQQLAEARKRVENKNKDGKYLAYFQSFTGTYAQTNRLEKLYRQAILPADIVGLAVATRPDCLPQETITLLEKINREKPVFVELGLQTANDATAKIIRRGYPTQVYFDAVKRLKAAGLEVITHIIIGLPGEDEAQALATTRAAVQAGTDGVKFHFLYVVKHTDLACVYLAGRYTCLSLEEYAAILKKCIALLPKETVVHRITGDGAKKDLIAPMWSADKKRTLNYLNQVLKE